MKMQIMFTPEAWDDYQFWLQHDKKIIERIHDLIKDITRTPFSGIGKPEPLCHEFKGYWSRRINQEHRLIYHIKDATLVMISARFHY